MQLILWKFLRLIANQIKLLISEMEFGSNEKKAIYGLPDKKSLKKFQQKDSNLTE